MGNYDLKEHLDNLHKKRRSRTNEKVDAAIAELIKKNEKVNFNSVSEVSGVTKATLYRNAEIRERIETLRFQQSKVLKPSQIKRQMNDENKDAIIASLKRRITKLERENERLKEQVKINYGEMFKNLR